MEAEERAMVTKADRLAPIEAQLSRQSELLGNLSDLLNLLENRISPILRGSDPEAPNKGLEEAGNSVMASVISDKNNRIASMCQYVDAIINRVEL